MPTSLIRSDFVLVAHLQSTWNRARKENQDPRIAVEREKRVFALIRQFDPTEGLYHGWLSMWRRRLWDARGFRMPVDLSELEGARRALSRFHALRDRLPADRRDVGQYRTVDDLMSVLPTRIAESRLRAEAEALKRLAHAESQIHFREGRWMVVELKGFTAARFWGLGTKWCTTTSERTYESYAGSGRMFVFLTPFGKFQLATRAQAFRDERDGNPDLNAFRSAPTRFRALLQQFHTSSRDRRG